MEGFMMSYTLACLKTVIDDQKGQLSLKPAIISIEPPYINNIEIFETEALWRKKIKSLSLLDKNISIYDKEILSPAFINPHTHLAMSFFRHFPLAASSPGNMIEDLFYHLESHLLPADVRAFTRMGAYESLLNGVGFVWDHYYFGFEIANALLDVGLSGVVAPTLQDLGGPGQKNLEQEWEATCKIDATANLSQSGIFSAFGPHATDTVSSPLWQRVCTEAKKKNIPVHIHCAQSVEESIRTMDREGLSPLEFLQKNGLEDVPSSLLVHSIFLSEKEIISINEKKDVLISCPFSALIFGLPADFTLWEKHKKKWLVATDCVASNDSMNVQKELRYISAGPIHKLTYDKDYRLFLSQKKNKKRLIDIQKFRKEELNASAQFRDPSYLLAKIWSEAGALHPKCRVGSLQKGSLANLIIWDQEHPSLWPGNQLRTLAFGDTSSAIKSLVVAGKWLWLANLVKQDKYLAHLEEANSRLKELLKRCGI